VFLLIGPSATMQTPTVALHGARSFFVTRSTREKFS
jgi:hypothetical protein